MALVSRSIGKPRKKKKPRISRRGAMLADQKVTGAEQVFTEETMPKTAEERKLTRAICLNWHSHYARHDEYGAELKKWMTAHKYTAEQIATVEKANWIFFPWTLKSHARMVSKGWIEDQAEIDWIKGRLQRVLDESKNPAHARKFSGHTEVELEGEEAPKPVEKKPVVKAVRESKLIEELDSIEDAWMKNEQRDVNMLQLLTSYREPQSVLKNKVLPWIEGRLKDLHDWKKGDEQCREGMPIKKGEVTRRIVVLETMKIEVEAAIKRPEGEKKPRKKKAIDPAKIVARLRFQKEVTEYGGLKSIDPVTIIGASALVLFNTKYRSVAVIQAEDGKKLDVRGSNVLNGTCKAIRLRKPDVIMPILKTNNLNKIMNELGRLTTKMVDGKPRTSNETILLRVFK